MSKEIAIPKSTEFTVAADIGMASELITMAAGAHGFGLNDLERVKVPSGGNVAWNIPTPDGIEVSQHMDVVIIDVRDVRSFWHQGSQNKAPDCASADGITGHGVPGGQCAICPWNQFKTAWDDAGRPANGKACKENKRITFFLPGAYLPTTLLLPPSSLGKIEGAKTDFTSYVRRLLSRGVPPHHVITRIELVSEKGQGGVSFSRVVFSKAAEIPKDERPLWNQLKETVGNSIRKTVTITDDPSETAEDVVATQ